MRCVVQSAVNVELVEVVSRDQNVYVYSRNCPEQQALMFIFLGSSASRSARCTRGCVPVGRSARGGSHRQPERNESLAEPTVGADVQLRPSPSDIGNADMAGQTRERSTCAAGNAEDRQGERFGLTRQVRRTDDDCRYWQVDLRGEQRLLEDNTQVTCRSVERKIHLQHIAVTTYPLIIVNTNCGISRQHHHWSRT